ncbi:MAG: hypothetical protein ACXQTE_05395, partial [Methanosarcinaceae archaeon]
LKAQIANQSNNPNKLDPPYLLFPRSRQVRDRWIIEVQVPVSSQVHRCNEQVSHHIPRTRPYASS